MESKVTDVQRNAVGSKRLKKATTAVMGMYKATEDGEDPTESDRAAAEEIALNILKLWDAMNAAKV